MASKCLEIERFRSLANCTTVKIWNDWNAKILPSTYTILMKNCQNWIHFQVNRPGQAYLQFSHCEWHTMWIFQDFPVTQILREINFADASTSKNVDFCNSKGFEICFWKISAFKKCKIHKIQNQEPLNVLQLTMADFALLESPKSISHKLWVI